MPSNDDKAMDPKELYMQLQYLQSVYSQQYEMLNQSIENYTAVQGAIRNNIEFIDNTSRVSGKEVLLSTEGGMYVNANIKKVESIIAYVGAGYLVEKKLDEAKQFFEDRVKKGDELISKLSAQRQKVREELAETNYRMSAFQESGMLD